MLGGVGGEAPAGVWEAIASKVSEPDEVGHLAPVTLLSETAAVRRRQSPRSSWALRATIAVAAVAVVLALIAGAQVSRLQSRVDHLSALSQQSGITQAAQAALLDPSATRIALTASTSASPSAAELVVLPSGSSFLINRHLTSLSSAQTYQLWGVVGGRTISLGVLGNHPTTVAFTLDPSARVSEVAITAERSGGVVVTSHAPVASAKIESA